MTSATMSTIPSRKIAPITTRPRNKQSSQCKLQAISSSNGGVNDHAATPESSTDDLEPTLANNSISRNETSETQFNNLSNSTLAKSGVHAERSVTPGLSHGEQSQATPDWNGDLKIIVTPDHELPQPLQTLYSEEKTVVEDSSKQLPEVAENPHNTFSPDGIEVRDNAEYVVEDEKAPIEPYFDIGFQSVLQKSYSVANQVTRELEKLEKTFGNDPNFQRLLDDAKELSKVDRSSTRTIAILGASGEGKSSLINSLLHVTELARTGDEGAACTSVVTEYRQKKASTLEPFSIEAEYLSNLDRQEMVEELLWSFRQLLLQDSDILTDQHDSDEQQRIERESEVAYSALEAVFGEEKGFDIEFLSDKSAGAFERIKAQLLEWTKNIELPADDDSGLWKATAETSDECQELTSVFMEDKLWPFTKIIRVYLDAEVLKTGVVLADLPGLQDTNLARVRATQKYLQTCDHVFIATKISRAITDTTLKSALYNELQRHVPLAWEESGGENLNFKLAVICTRSEDINEKTAKRTFVGKGKGISTGDIGVIEKDIDNAKSKGDKKLQKELERKKLWLFIEARNRHVTERLQCSYKQKTSNGKLEVFYISNTTYEKYAERGNFDMVQKSGIPELRCFCRKITANAQLLQALHFMRTRLPSLLNSIKIWTESTHVLSLSQGNGTKTTFLDRHERSKKEAVALVMKHNAELRSALQSDIIGFFNKASIRWEEKAIMEANKWSQWHHQSYNAWCRNSGEHTTKTRGYVNWNAEITGKMRRELKTNWGLFEKKIPTSIESLLEDVNGQLRSLQDYIKEQEALATMQYGIDFRIQDLEYNFSFIQQEFSRGFRIIRQYVEEPNASSYIVAEMTPAYRKAGSEGGTGMKARQISIVTKQIASGTIYPNISAKMRQGAVILIDHEFSKLGREVSDSYDLIGKDIDMAITEKPQSCKGVLGAEAKRLTERFGTNLTRLRMEYDRILRDQQDVVAV